MSRVREVMLFLAVITSKMHFFAIVICLPILTKMNFPNVDAYEVGTLIATYTAGNLLAGKYAEPIITSCGLWTSLNVGFLVLFCSSISFWTCLIALN